MSQADRDEQSQGTVPVTRTQIELPIATILKVLVTIGLLLILGEIW